MEFGMWGRRRVKRVGIVSTRLAGTDGVSLESDKWVQVMEERRITCYYFAGELDRPPDRSYLAEEAHLLTAPLNIPHGMRCVLKPYITIKNKLL